MSKAEVYEELIEKKEQGGKEKILDGLISLD